MNRTPDPKRAPVKRTRRPVRVAASAAVLSLIAAGVADTVPTNSTRPPVYVGGGVWGSG